MSDIERSLTYLEAQVKYLMQRDAEREGSAMAKPSLTTETDNGPPYEFDRYIGGVLMAEGVTIEREASLSGAMIAAARLAEKGSYGKTPVLIYRAKAKQPEPSDPVVEWERMNPTAAESIAYAGLRLIRDLSEEELVSLAWKAWGGNGSKEYGLQVARAAIDAVLGPVKGESK